MNMAFSASPPGKSSTSTKKQQKSQIVIFGKITNIEQAKKFLNEDSFLVLYNADQGIKAVLKVGGIWLVPDENSVKTKLLDEGNFRFEMTSLDPGQYIILIQPVKGFTTGNASMALVVDENTKKTIQIKYPFETENQMQFDLKNVLLQVP
jgi:hypothetical protein